MEAGEDRKKFNLKKTQKNVTEESTSPCGRASKTHPVCQIYPACNNIAIHTQRKKTTP